MYKLSLPISIVFILLGVNLSFSQYIQGRFEVPDSLADNSYAQIFYKFKQNSTDTILAKTYLETYLAMAEGDKDSLTMAKAYTMLSYYENNDINKLNFLDHSIELSKDLKHHFYPAFAYATKGGFYLRTWNYEKALDNYLVALDFTKKNKNGVFQYIIEHNIGIIKSKLGKHKEALKIFKKCLEYEEARGIQDTLDYLEIIVDLSESYTKNELIDSSNLYLRKGFALSDNFKTNTYQKLTFNLGVNYYQNKEFERSEHYIEESLPSLSQLEDKRYMVNAYYYLGKIYEERSKDKKAISYFKKVDSVFKSTKFITPEVRDGYPFLINYYKNKEEYQHQLFYVERLLKFDNILHQNNISVNEKLIKKYDTVELLAEQEKLIQFIHQKNSGFKKSIWFLALGILIISILFYYQYSRRKRYAKRFKSLVEENRNTVKVEEISVGKKTEKRDLKISEDIKDDIIEKIDKFEAELGFLKPNITTNSLATNFKTNSKYISRIVNTYKGKNFTNYINDLRIEYLIEELKTNSKFRNYTVKAIAGEIGFNTTEAFSKYFYKKTGLYPSYFIKKMENFSK